MPSISIGSYLIKRLKEINIDTIFGVPGDYNMVRMIYTRYRNLLCCSHCIPFSLSSTLLRMTKISLGATMLMS